MFNWKDYIAKNWLGTEITDAESEILFMLHVHADGFVPHDDLLEFVYPDPDVEPIDPLSVIKVQISGLRKKFGKDIIINRCGYGYMINNPCVDTSNTI